MRGASSGINLFLLIIFFSAIGWSSSPTLRPFSASPDQVLVLYNADWRGESKDSAPGQDSEEVAHYYVTMHTDPVTGKKPYLLGLRCVHGKKHLNRWVIDEQSNDNKNGLLFKGKGKPPESYEWIRDSRRVEICIDEPAADWDSLSIKCRSQLDGAEETIYPGFSGVNRGELAISGIPSARSHNRSYPAIQEGKGRCFRFDASKVFPGTVKVSLSLKDRSGRVLRDLSLVYYDLNDFEFTQTGPDEISDEKNLNEDVLDPVRKFLQDPAHALSDGTLLKDRILYIVVIQGMPYASKAVFGIEHGATTRKGDHGALASLEQRLQTIYYDWKSVKPPVISMNMVGGPDSGKGVVNNIISTAMRYPLAGVNWKPYMHPDTYSFLGKNKNKPPVFYDLSPLLFRRKTLPQALFIYGVSRIDGASPEEAKRIIDYSVYATKYLRPEMDCYVRQMLKKEGRDVIPDLPERVKKAEADNLWGDRELETLGFRVISRYEGQGLPFMVRAENDMSDDCKKGKADWNKSGFYPGGMERGVVSSNGWNMSTAPIWRQLKKGVTVSACGAPAYEGGPHITNATFWDNRILMRYLFRGRDLGECFLLSTYYINWSTSLIGDPLMHPDLMKTVVDRTPPKVTEKDLTVKTEKVGDYYRLKIRADLKYDPQNPEVVILKLVCTDDKGIEISDVSPLYSRRPAAELRELKPDRDYACRTIFIDPYGNKTELSPLDFSTKK
jgi:hypothetical protein